MTVIVIEFITLDGIVSDPDGSDGTPAGGWAFRHGPGTVAGDKFRLGSTLDDGVMLLGRRTWQLFSRLWPPRDDPFSARMNAVPKLVATRTLTDTSPWANSRVIDEDLIDAVRREQRDPQVKIALRDPTRGAPARRSPHPRPSSESRNRQCGLRPSDSSLRLSSSVSVRPARSYTGGRPLASLRRRFVSSSSGVS